MPLDIATTIRFVGFYLFRGIIFLIFSCPFVGSLQAADFRWSVGFGQGNYEYSIDVNQYRFYISCPTEYGSVGAPSSIEFSVNGNYLKSFEIAVGGRKYLGPLETSSRVGANNFTELLDDLKKTNAVISFLNGRVTLPKSNANSVLPTYGKNGFACNLDGP